MKEISAKIQSEWVKKWKMIKVKTKPIEPEHIENETLTTLTTNSPRSNPSSPVKQQDKTKVVGGKPATSKTELLANNETMADEEDESHAVEA